LREAGGRPAKLPEPRGKTRVALLKCAAAEAAVQCSCVATLISITIDDPKIETALEEQFGSGAQR
jgi:hypothetical protein